jgi:glycerophosphoryl diester phosphodiesterase
MSLESDSTTRIGSVSAGLPLVIAHRGASHAAPENTLAAFRLARLEGADGVEFDVRLARDGVPVCIHDATLRRTGRADGAVAALTSAELCEREVGSWFNLKFPSAARPVYARECVPTLGHVLDSLRDWARAVYLEMKFERGEDFAPLAARVVEAIRSRGLEDRVVVESFTLEAVGEVGRIAPEVRRAALFKRTAGRPPPSARRIVAEAARVGATELALHRSLVRPALLDAARRAGLRSLVWTADTPEWAARARALGLCAVITNRPALMRASVDALRGAG